MVRSSDIALLLEYLKTQNRKHSGVPEPVKNKPNFYQQLVEIELPEGNHYFAAHKSLSDANMFFGLHKDQDPRKRDQRTWGRWVGGESCPSSFCQIYFTSSMEEKIHSRRFPRLCPKEVGFAGVRSRRQWRTSRRRVPDSGALPPTPASTRAIDIGYDRITISYRDRIGLIAINSDLSRRSG